MKKILIFLEIIAGLAFYLSTTIKEVKANDFIYHLTIKEQELMLDGEVLTIDRLTEALKQQLDTEEKKQKCQIRIKNESSSKERLMQVKQGLRKAQALKIEMVE